MRTNDGRLIKAARVYYGMSQKELAKKINVDQTAISAMESGTRQSVWQGFFDKAAKELRLEDPHSPFVRSVAKYLCVICNGGFTPKRSNAQYCSSACRQKAYRRRTHI